MNVIWVNRKDLTSHPIAKGIFTEFTKQKYSVLNASPNENTESFTFFRSKYTFKILDAFKWRSLNIYFVLGQNFSKSSSKFLKRIDMLFLVQFPLKIVSLANYVNSTFKLTFSNPSIVIVSHPETIPAVFPLKLLDIFRIRRCKFVYFPFEIYGHQSHKSSRVLFWIEKAFIKWFLDGLITQNWHRKIYYLQINQKIPVTVFPNTKKMDKSSTEQILDRDNKLQIIYLGMFSNARDFDFVLKSAEDMKDKCKFTFIGFMTKNFDENLKQKMKEMQLDGVIEIRQEVPEEKIVETLSQFHVGLISYDNTCLNHLYCAPAKLIDYLSANLSILAPSFPSMKLLKEKCEEIYLYVPSSSISLSRSIDQIISDFQNKNLVKNSIKSDGLYHEIDFTRNFSKFIEFLTAAKND